MSEKKDASVPHNRSWKLISKAELMVSGQEVCFCSVQRQSLRIFLAVLNSQLSVVGCWVLFFFFINPIQDVILKMMWNWRDFEEHKRFLMVRYWWDHVCVGQRVCFVFIYLPVFLFKKQ